MRDLLSPTAKCRPATVPQHPVHGGEREIDRCRACCRNQFKGPADNCIRERRGDDDQASVCGSVRACHCRLARTRDGPFGPGIGPGFGSGQVHRELGQCALHRTRGKGANDGIPRRYAGRCTACRCTACRKARTAPRVAPVQTRRSAQVDPVGRPGRQGMHGKLGQCRLRLSLKAPMLADTL